MLGYSPPGPLVGWVIHGLLESLWLHVWGVAAALNVGPYVWQFTNCIEFVLLVSILAVMLSSRKITDMLRGISSRHYKVTK